MSRNVDLYLNLARPSDSVLLAGRRDLTIAEPPVWIDGEKPLVRIQFLTPSATPGVAPEVTQLADGDVVVFALKKKTGGTLLVSGTGFVLEGAGNERRYAALVNFDTTELVNALGDETVISTVGEVRVQNAANTERKVFQFRCTVRGRIYNGEGDPLAADPEYPAIDSLALRVPENGTYRVKTTGDGQYWQLKHALTGKFHTLFVTGDDGAEELAIGPGED